MSLAFTTLLKQCQNNDRHIGIGDQSLPSCDFGMKIGLITAIDMLSGTN